MLDGRSTPGGSWDPSHWGALGGSECALQSCPVLVNRKACLHPPTPISLLLRHDPTPPPQFPACPTLGAEPSCSQRRSSGRVMAACSKKPLAGRQWRMVNSTSEGRLARHRWCPLHVPRAKGTEVTFSVSHSTLATA